MSFIAAGALILNKTRNPEVTMRWRGFRLKAKTVGTIYKVGLPMILAWLFARMGGVGAA